MTKVFVALGSNLGDRLDYLIKAINAILNHPQNVLLKVSNVYETEPVGFMAQARFLNAVIQIDTTLKPIALLNFLQDVEFQFDRTREIQWGPRTIDLDIIAIENFYFNSPRLKIPHAHMLERLFVLQPLVDIAPNFEIFGTNGTVETYINRLDKSSQIDYYLSSEKLMNLSREE